MSDSGGWNTIESDAGVFTFLLDNLGVKDVQFEELLSLDTESLQVLQPHLYGVIFLFKFPTDKPYNDPNDRPEGGPDPAAAERLFFAKQTIQNACGTQALLSVVMNKTEGVDAGNIEVGEKLREFREFTMALPPDFRGEALSNSELIRDVHNSFARSSPFADETGRKARSPEEAEDVFHFIAYSSIGGTLYELDGLQRAPLNHGACTQKQLPEKLVPVLRSRIERYGAGEIRFNLMAMIRDPRVAAREIGDQETLEREERKRALWRWENALRRHNFVGFAGEVLKNVVKRKEDEGKFSEWVDDAKKTMDRRMDLMRSQGGGDVEMTDS
ncbi:putative 26s proteasome-associated ubiquitin carboxyl-terminal hydrolase [Zalerion maritima]|uniref:Ubiquitin carboxyl-terminal hydrolase n=1 Tax=Zalerion maritima TaxID=339359 RepID=A0AAD5RYY9_9PEZI|nr:putative 26s proteasome-associated ubiquitin carboxyl-terminal hydrolase [Zalerion maritima]